MISQFRYKSVPVLVVETTVYALLAAVTPLLQVTTCTLIPDRQLHTYVPSPV